MKQLPLPIQLLQRTTFKNFLAGDNKAAVDCLQQMASDQAEPQVLIWADAARGKTHILQALCHLASSHGLRTAYLPLSDPFRAVPEMLEGMENMDLVCVDDVDAVAGISQWEEALFGLINSCRQSQCGLVFSSSNPPNDAGFNLPDLSSRLLWGPVFQLNSLSDPQLYESLRHRAEGKGLLIDEAVLRFLMDRCHRDISSLISVIDKLDEEALAQQRRITIPFVKDVLGL